ncbi:hypothetical protein [Aliikangiella maris]|uniref:Uncharacterized protein n=3 Tax=Aliikangiella maris TaxID=3162458 RepID=A0ABV2BZU6_9GAMM
MIRTLLLLTLLTTSSLLRAENVNCIGVYVGRISIDKTLGLNQVVFLSNPNNSSGSYWANFSGWEASAKKEALSVLMAAKASKHRVDVYTTATDNCSIGVGGQTLTTIHLSTKP